jgi:hypothetical protein
MQPGERWKRPRDRRAARAVVAGLAIGAAARQEHRERDRGGSGGHREIASVTALAGGDRERATPPSRGRTPETALNECNDNGIVGSFGQPPRWKLSVD